MDKKLKFFKSIIKVISFTSLFILLLSFTSGSFLYFYYSAKYKNRGKDFFKEEVEKYPYVLEEYTKLGYQKSQVIKLLSETWIKRGFEYDYRTVFREKAREGEYVNVSRLGFRRNDINSPSDEFILNNNDINNNINLVYFFGGSTTFGYGVEDRDTIPAQLEKISNNKLKVFNFGRGYYFSQQENDLLYELIRKGAPIPKYAIFLDGINERCWGTPYGKQLKLIFNNVSYNEFKWEANEYAKPLLFLFSKLSKKFSNNNRVGLKFWDPRCSYNQKSFSSRLNLKDAFAITIRQRQDLCDRHKIRCITFIQPMPGYLNIHKHLSFGLNEAKAKIDLLTKDVNNPNFNIEDITGSLKNYNRHAYIDGIHYSSSASKIIAKKIFKKINKFKDF